jgi:hypothetical protein
MTTDFRALLADLIESVDDLPFECNWKGEPSGPLADFDDGPLERARAALAEGAGVGPTHFQCKTDREQLDDLWCEVGGDINVAPLTRISFANALLARYATHPRPIPVAERPWEREGFCDARGLCWWTAGTGEVWTLCRPSARATYGWMLPFFAIPLPAQEGADG